MTFDVVIGANFGDEGKGLMTDYLANHYGNDVIVVRFNGGAQAGHTVVTPEGKRHVFSHFGSGAFANAATYLSEHFISNPILFLKEREQLINLDTKVNELYVHDLSKVTTPYDMIINQGLESKRNKDRHGSCGSGINETMIRDGIIPLRARDLRQAQLVDKLYEIRKYALYKAKTLKLDTPFVNQILSPNVFRQFLSDCLEFNKFTIPCDDINYALSNYEHIIFEGAQGLLLDMDHEYFPHVTHSKTGMHNVNDLLEELDVYWENKFEVNVYYMTRGYLTRHGAGPFPLESKDGKQYDTIYDKTNVHNEWQESLRFGILDLATLLTRTTEDKGNLKVNMNIVATCMDQLPNEFTIGNAGIIREITKENFYKFLANHYTKVYISEGETRSTITNIEVCDE